MTKNIIGVIWMIVHVLCAAIISSFSRVLYDSFHPFHISLFYNFTAFIIALPFIIKYRQQLIKSCFTKEHALRGALYTSAQLIFVFVYNHVPFARVAGITTSYPLFTTMFAVIFLGEKIGPHRIIALIFGFTGALIIINPLSSELNTYSLCAVIGIIMWAVFDMVTNKIGHKESIHIQLMHLLIFMGAFSIVPASTLHIPTISLQHMFLFFLVGCIIIIYMLSAVLAVAEAEISIVSLFYFTTLPISSSIGYFIFGETIAIRTIIGSSIILFSFMYIAHREYKAKKIAKQLQQSRLI